MPQVRVTKTFVLEMAHALWGYDGPCKNIHGHTYHFSITVIGEILNNPVDPKNGMVMDFSELKKIVQHEVVNSYDHSLVLNENTDQKLLTGLRENFEKIFFVPFQPTCENLLIEFKNKVAKQLPAHLKIHHVCLQETSTSYAEWYRNDN